DLILAKYGVRKPRSGAERLQQLERYARMVNMIIPVGWLPYGVMTSVEGRILPSMLAILGLAVIGTASLKRSYATTLRLYTGRIRLGLTQLAGNQFGFDRNGFRVFVLAGAPRKDILLGKNLALFPFALGLGVIGTVALQFAYPMRIDHFLAALVQMISMYLIF